MTTPRTTESRLLRDVADADSTFGILFRRFASHGSACFEVESADSLMECESVAHSLARTPIYEGDPILTGFGVWIAEALRARSL